MSYWQRDQELIEELHVKECCATMDVLIVSDEKRLPRAAENIESFMPAIKVCMQCSMVYMYIII